MSHELEHIWSRVQAQLALAVDEPTYRIWLADLRPVELVGERLVIEAPPQTVRWIQGRFGRVIEASVELVLGPLATTVLRPAGETGSVTRRLPGAPRGSPPARRRRRRAKGRPTPS